MKAFLSFWMEFAEFCYCLVIDFGDTIRSKQFEGFPFQTFDTLLKAAVMGEFSRAASGVLKWEASTTD